MCEYVRVGATLHLEEKKYVEDAGMNAFRFPLHPTGLS